MAIDLRTKSMKRTTVKSVHDESTDVTIGEFMELHKEFLTAKQLENLSPTTMADHEIITLLTYGEF